jgi:hypothetical protein
VKIMGDLGQLPDLHLDEMALVAPPAAQKAGAVLFEQLARIVPPELAIERIVALAQIALHMCANRARLQENPEESRAHVADDVFVDNLIDMTTAALFAPTAAPTPEPRLPQAE